MGAIPQGQGGVTYYSIFQGQITRRLKDNEEPLEGEIAVERKLSKGPKEGSTVREVYYRGLVGFLKDIKVSGDKIKSWDLKIDDVDTTMILQLPYTSDTAKRFLYRLEDIDLNSELTITAGQFRNNDDKLIQWCHVEQNGEKLITRYTRDNMGDLPEAEWTEVNGEKVLNFGKQFEYFKTFIESTFPYGSSETVNDTQDQVKSEDGPPTNDSSDLPF